jgi:beta-glucosidase
MLKSFIWTTVGAYALILTSASAAPLVQPALDGNIQDWLQVDGFFFHDLNRDGRLQPYEDWRLSPRARTKDLIGRMTLEEKAGAMMHGTAPAVDGEYGSGTAYDTGKAEAIIDGLHVNTMVTRLNVIPEEFARQNNLLQALGAKTRLGIPVTISSDPRHYYQATQGASVNGKGFTKWPEALGFAAINDPTLTRRFADIARREYRAVGIQMALSPQADLATEPRWPRINGTFGEDVNTVIAQSRAYVEGIQNGDAGLNSESVIAIAKHWVGYGAAANEGYDSHNYYGRYAEPGNALATHIKAFNGVFQAKVAGVMPTYSILKNTQWNGKGLEPVGAGYSKILITDALRRGQGFDGLVLSDFAITDDCNDACRDGAKPGEAFGVSMAWGVDRIAKVDRFAMGVNAGLDQFGGTEEVGPLIEAIKTGRVTRARIDESVYRIMLQKMQIGLFEKASVDPQIAARWVGVEPYLSEGEEAQSKAMVVLKTGAEAWPLQPGQKVFLHNLDKSVAQSEGLTPVDTVDAADVAVVRISAPYKITHTGYMFGSFQHEGDLDFKDGDSDLVLIEDLAKTKPVIVVVYLDRPAVLTRLLPLSTSLIADFGASDKAVLDALTGRVKPVGRLPFDLPSSMASVRKQSPAVPSDDDAPLFPVNFRSK